MKYSLRTVSFTNVLSGNRYWYALASLSLVLVLSVSGLFTIWHSPGRSLPPKHIVIPNLNAPTFTYRRNEIVDWQSGKRRWSDEAEVSSETGRKILRLLRGSQTWGAYWQEYHRQHPEETGLLTVYIHRPSFLLAVRENGSTTPSLTVTFEAGGIIEVNGERYIAPPNRWAEVTDLLVGLNDTSLPEDSRLGIGVQRPTPSPQ
jgi:hypothetical protein